jgi:hypothetical protein
LTAEGQQGDGREEPADGVVGSVGHDQSPDAHEGAEAHQQHRLVGRVLLEAAVGDREDDPDDQADDVAASMDQATRVQRLPTAPPRLLRVL